MGTYRRILLHIIFSTKYRTPTLTRAHDEEIYKYISGITKNKNCHLYCINGVEDHIHIMSALHPQMSLSDYVKDIKVASSLWLKGNDKFPGFRGWQDGYGGFTISYEDKDRIINYIKNQKEHHKTESFQDEFRRLLIENGITFDENNLW